MLSIVSLTLFNILVLLIPLPFVSSILELTNMPFSGRFTLLLAVIVNVALSMAFERWGAPTVAAAVGYLTSFRKRHRVRDGKTYKFIESGMR
jgi:cation-transporting P-type ATPase 13A2